MGSSGQGQGQGQGQGPERESMYMARLDVSEIARLAVQYQHGGVPCAVITENAEGIVFDFQFDLLTLVHWFIATAHWNGWRRCIGLLLHWCVCVQRLLIYCYMEVRRCVVYCYMGLRRVAAGIGLLLHATTTRCSGY